MIELTYVLIVSGHFLGRSITENGDLDFQYKYFFHSLLWPINFGYWLGKQMRKADK